MKIIDLLNKIAKGEEVPKKIKYKGNTYKKDNDGDIDFYVGEDFNGTLFLEKLDDTNELNDEVEIIEEDKGIEKIPLPTFEEFKNMSAEERYLITAKEYDLLDDLIDEVNKLKGKSE